LTESEWLRCFNPATAFRYLWKGKKISDRKRWLFVVACCRYVWHLLPDDRYRAVVETVERFADGHAGRAEMVAARAAVAGMLRDRCLPGGWWNEALMVQLAVGGDAAAIARGRVGEDGDVEISKILRDLLGNPFRPASLRPALHDPAAAVALARGIYDTRSFEELPILADALEESGFTDEAILSHCRGPGPHVRGCWVVDLVLARE
jgi:hypothetical protein